MSNQKIDALVHEAIKTIKLSTDYVDWLFFRNDSLYAYCRTSRNPVVYQDVQLTTQDPSLSDEERQALYTAVLNHVQSY